MRHLIRRLIEEYIPFPGEEEAVASFHSVLGTPRPVERDQFVPGHFTASGFVVSPDLSSVLLIHHRRLDRWMQPGGHIDAADETPWAAARREIGEETGMFDLEDLSTGLFGLGHHPIPARHDEPPHRHFDLKFAFLAVGHHLAPSSEVGDVTWGRFEEMEMFGVDAETMHEVQKLRLLI